MHIFWISFIIFLLCGAAADKPASSRGGAIMGKIYLIRHAEAEGNLYRRVHGWYDSALTHRGLEQAASLTQRFHDVHIDAVYTSDLRRARTTAQAIANPRGLAITEEPNLREIHMGIYEDVPVGEMEFSHGPEYALFRARSLQWIPSEGETFRQVRDRAVEVFFRLARRHQSGTIALFSHKATLHTLQAALHGLSPEDLPPLPSQNTAVSCYEVKKERFRILFENDISHLPPLLLRPKTLSVRFRPIIWSQEEDFYRSARRDAWLAVHPDLLTFDGPGYLQEAREQSVWDPRAVQIALDGEEPVGLLQLSTFTGAQAGVGRVPLLWVQESHRRQGVGVQLLGQAVSTYRGMGRTSLRLQCSPKNLPAQTFYAKYGFSKVGQVPGLQGALDLLALPI